MNIECYIQHKHVYTLSVMTESLKFPKSSFEKEFAFSMDFGSSAIKLVYTTEEDDNLVVNFTRFPKDKLDEALEFIKEICGGKLGQDTEIMVCGVGASREIDNISEELSLRLKMVPEGDSGLEAVIFMAKHLTWDSLVYSPHKDADLCGAARAKHYATIMGSISHGKMKPWPYMSDAESSNAKVVAEKMTESVQFPIILVGIGSGCMVGKMEADGSFLPYSGIDSPAGRTFLGLGSLLTGAKDFSELAELAERGDASKVDQWLGNLDINPDDELYNKMLNSNIKLFAFGHAAGKSLDGFKKEDLAAAIVSLILSSAAEQAYYWAAHHKLKQVFFCAGFAVSTPYIRHELEKEFSSRRFANSLNHVCECRILKHGAHLGALGILMKNLGFKEGMC